MGTETTQIIDLNAEKGKEVQEGEKGWKLLGKLYDGALKGIPGSKSVEALAQEYLSNCGGKKEQAAEQLIRMQVTKCTTTGFLTGLGGLITLPATITADIGSSMYVQIRMIAAIAVMGGYSLQDDVVKSMVFATLLKVEVGNLLKQVGVKTANRASLQLLKKTAGNGSDENQSEAGLSVSDKVRAKRCYQSGKGCTRCRRRCQWWFESR